MAEIESAADFAVSLCAHPECDGGEYGMDSCCRVLAEHICKRDTAMLELAAKLCEERAHANHNEEFARIEAEYCAAAIRALAASRVSVGEGGNG